MFLKNWGNKSKCFFFGGQPHIELSIADSKFAKFWQPWAWLGGSMMDFLNFSHYFSSLLDIQKAIFVTSALITPSLKKLCFGTRGGTKVMKLEAIMGWAKSHLSLGGGENRYDTMVIPYHGEVHWSLLMLELSHTFHFDSKIGVHDYSVCDIFISQISCRALLLL
jgi:hypothetical protein